MEPPNERLTMELRAIRSFYDNRYGLVTLEDDVLSIVSQVRELYGDRLYIAYDQQSDWYHVIERCADGVERLVFTVETLDQRVVERILLADSQGRGHTDPYAFAEREQDQLQAAKEEKDRERLREAGERLVHALKKEGLQPHLPLTVAIPRGVDDAHSHG